MNPKDFFLDIVEPTLHWLTDIPEVALPVTDEARVLVMAIAGQEGEWQYRRQVGGPARSFWQFEQGGGVAGLFRVTPRQLRAVCDRLSIPCDQATVFEAMAWNDTLACAMARLLLWTDPAPLPPVGAAGTAWSYYQRNWEPGAPHPEKWPARYATARSYLVYKGSK